MLLFMSLLSLFSTLKIRHFNKHLTILEIIAGYRDLSVLAQDGQHIIQKSTRGYFFCINALQRNLDSNSENSNIRRRRMLFERGSKKSCRARFIEDESKSRNIKT